MFIGSTIASFIPGSDAISLSSAVQTIVDNPDALSDLSATAVYINGKTYATSSSSPSKSDSDSTSSSSSTTVIVVSTIVGIFGTVLIILGVYFGIHKYEKLQQGRRLIDEPRDQYSNDTNENIQTSTTGKTNDIQLTQSNPMSRGILSKNPNQVKPITTNKTNDDRPGSTAVSVNMLQFSTTNNDDRANITSSTVQLINHD